MADPTFIGFAFPFGKSTTAFPAEATDEELIKFSLIQILMTGRGERVMRPDFGSGAWTWIFENNDEVFAELIRADVMATIAKFEPRVIVQDIVVDRNESEVVVEIVYIVIATQQQDSVELTVPAA